MKITKTKAINELSNKYKIKPLFSMPILRIKFWTKQGNYYDFFFLSTFSFMYALLLHENNVLIFLSWKNNNKNSYNIRKLFISGDEIHRIYVIYILGDSRNFYHAILYT